MFGFGKNSKRAKRRREQEEKLRRFKEEIQEVPLERNDYRWFSVRSGRCGQYLPSSPVWYCALYSSFSGKEGEEYEV